MDSLGVDVLFTNIPKRRPLKFAQAIFFWNTKNLKPSKARANLNLSSFCVWLLKIRILFSMEHYKQIDSVATGSPLDPIRI